jgi:hypothetical protein
VRNVWLAALALGACAEGPPQAQPPPLVRAELAPGAAGAASGEARLTVRATRGGLPIAARCEAVGEGFAARFDAPADVAVPSFGAESRPVQVACEADGRRGARLAQPAIRPAGPGGGFAPVIGVGVSTGGDAGVSLGGWWGGGGWGGPRPYAVRYPDVEVALD